MTNNCRKGKRVELKVVHWLHSLGFNGARRGQQYAGGTDSPDVIVPELPNVHFEVKGRVGRPSVAEMERWLARASQEAKGKIPLLVVVENGRAPMLVWESVPYGCVVAALNDAAAKEELTHRQELWTEEGIRRNANQVETTRCHQTAQDAPGSNGATGVQVGE